MSLIPLITRRLMAPSLLQPAGPSLLERGSYDSGGAHRPLAALLAGGLPALLVVAVALSPMAAAIKQVITETKVILIKQPPPPPPPPSDPRADPASPKESTSTVIPTRLPPLAENPVRDLETTPPMPSKPFVPLSDPPVTPVHKPVLAAAQLDLRYARGFQPDYPPSAIRREIEGIVRVRVLVGIDGRVKAVERISAPSDALFEATKARALAKWRFKPATRDGVPEEGWQVVPVRFELDNA